MLTALIDGSVRHRAVILLSAFFISVAGVWALLKTPIDALPDLSDVQVVVVTDYAGQAPHVVENQVTYPLTTALLSVPKSRVVRGFSYFGVSFVYVIFEEGTDIYWARSRVLESLKALNDGLPSSVSPKLGPDASGAGWVYQYAVVGLNQSLAELRSLQDWLLRPQLTRAQGIAEIASVGGFVQQYQVVADPIKLRAYNLSLTSITNAIRNSNTDVGGRAIELSETEYMVRGRGYLRGAEDLENIVIKTNAGTAVVLRDVAQIALGPDERRGIAELNGEGEVVSGIAVARHGQNALTVIDNVKQKLAEVQTALPSGVSIQAVYDRSDLIHRAISTLRSTLIEEALIVAAVCAVFLLHVRSALVVIVMLPVSVLMAFIGMHLLGMNSNIMSLGGLAIAVGTMVDAAMVMIENAHKHLEGLPAQHDAKDRFKAIVKACKEVGPALFVSLLIIVISFLPVFALEDQEGRLFSPLAWTKTLAMASSALLSVTLVPVLMLAFIRGRIRPEGANPTQKFLVRLYQPMIARVLQHRGTTVGLAVLVTLASIWPASHIGSEFMPTLNEGTLFYMPTGQPAMSVTTAAELLQVQNKIIKSFPEVASVFGKSGRAQTATDPAPIEMFETVINLKPEREWRSGVSLDSLVAELDKALQFPGVANSWTMPIKARIDMLSTGIRSPVGIKVFGKDLDQIEEVAKAIEGDLKKIPGTSSAYAERVTGGWYLDIEPDRSKMARYGVLMNDLKEVIASALGGEVLTTMVDGRQRIGVAVRYPRDMRDDPQKIMANVLVPTAADGAGNASMVPIGEMATLHIKKGASSIRTENSLLVAYVYVDVQGRDIGSYVAEAQKAVAAHVQMPEGVFLAWSGQYEYMERANERLRVVIPVTLLIIGMLLYLYFRNWRQTLIVLLSLPFALVGGFWFMWAMGYHMSVAAAIGFVALAGVAAETGIVMLIYLDQAWQNKLTALNGQAPRMTDLASAIVDGAVGRVRPKMMTVVAVIAGLMPILWSTGAGSDVMRRIAAPMVGGMLSSAILTLLVIPAVYALVMARKDCTSDK
ncbi:efflux RND transporter permease subunit [Limnohabitans sp. Jir72]|uniref:efflux RND transporter permease subunit n=1 Tax=Limnohabitans sp. Jir72 TaxID=1977909 RepID=UPI000D36E9BD|nr:CusA/CzcA family heavy metal efflux RND transporter [Limnohabitans sp. Jir72]PUE26436.1 CusA/CzcA family heavy metal efflux RND transporter [Limnohabitans sp. Jir72]